MNPSENHSKSKRPERDRGQVHQSGKSRRKRKVNESFRHSFGRDPRWWRYFAAGLVVMVILTVALMGGRGMFGFSGDAQSYYQRGLDHYQNQDYKSAVIELKNALDQDPGYSKARKLLGESYLAMNELARARQELALAKELGISQGHQDAAVRFEDATVRFDKRDFRGAIIQLRKVLEENPNDAVAHSLLGRAYLEIDNGQVAETHLRKARQGGTDPTLIVVPLARAYLLQRKYKLLFSLIHSGQFEPELRSRLLVIGGRAHLAKGEADRADKLFSEAEKLDPKAIDPLMGQARIRLLQGQFAEAQALADKTRLLTSDNSEVWHLQAEIMRYQRNLDQALEYYDKALEVDPTRSASRKGRAEALLALHRDKEALAELKAMHETSSTDPQAAYLYALALSRNDQLSDAQDVLAQLALVIDSLNVSFVQNDPPTLLIAGVINYAKKNYERAYEQLTRYIVLRPDNVESRQLLASLMLRRGDAEGAVDILVPVLKSVMDNPQALIALGSAYNRLGHHNKAMGMFERAVELVPDQAGLRNRLALSRLASGKRQQAVGDLQSRFAEDPETGDVGLLLGLVHLKQREFNKALDVALELIKRRPDNAMTHNLAGAAQLGLGDTGAARVSFLKSLEITPEFLPGRFNLAKLNLKQGNVDAARSGLLKILESHPRHVGALLELAAVDTRLKHLDLALDWLLRARKADPGSLLVGLRLVEFYLAAEKPQKALDQARELEARYPKNLPVLAGVSRSQFALGNSEVAAGILQTMAGYAVGNPRKLQAVAVQQMQFGDLTGAQSTLRQLLELKPNFLPARSLLIQIAVRNKQFDQALERVGELKRLRPDAAVTDVLEGGVLVAMKRYAEAAEAFKRALDKKPDGIVLLQYYHAQRDAGSPQSALSALQAWHAKYPSDIMVQRVLASAYLDAGRLQASIKLHESLLETLGDDAILINNLASLYQQSADPRALKFAQRAYALAPEQAATLDTLGWILVRKGEAVRGLKYLRQAQNRAAKDLRVGYHIAVALDSLGRQDDARQQLEKTLKKGKAFEGIEDARKLLRRLSGQSS